MKTKNCTKCSTELPITDFDFTFRKNRSPEARQSACRICRNYLRRLRLKTDPAYKKQRSDSKKAQHKALRTKVLNHYGHKCNCLCGCSVTTYEYLTFDHINGREGNHRRQQNNRTGFAGQALVKWLIDNNYPDTIQILCYNCNCSKGAHGVCPRVKELQEVGRNDQPHTFKEDFYPSLYL